MKTFKNKLTIKSVLILFILLIIFISIIFSINFVTEQKQHINDSKAATISSYKIGVYMFPMFNKDDVKNNVSLNEGANPGCQALYGRTNDQWCGVRDFYAGNTQGWGGDWSYLKPVQGYYDDSQTSYWENTIMQIKQNGFSFINFYYYWDDTNVREMLPNGMNAYLSARNKNDLELMLSLYTGVETANFGTATDNIVNKYLTQPNYSKTTDGRPIIVLGDMNSIGSGTTKGTVASITTFLQMLTDKTLNKVGKKPFLIGSEGGVPAAVANIDGNTCLNEFYNSLNSGATTVGDYRNYVNKIPSLHKTYNAPYLTCGMQNFNEQPRTNVVRWDTKASIRYDTNQSLTLFQQAMQKEKAFMDSRTDVMSKYMTIYAWNEWYEGGIMEPNIRDGALYLKTVANVFGLQRGTDPCADTGNCIWSPPSNIQGSLDVATCTNIAGWVWQTSNPNQSLDVYIEADQAYPNGGSPTKTTANILRSDVISVTHDNGLHGYSIALPDSLRDGNLHSIYVTAISIVGGSPNLLIQPVKQIQCAKPTNTISPTFTSVPKNTPMITPTNTLTPIVSCLCNANNLCNSSCTFSKTSNAGLSCSSEVGTPSANDKNSYCTRELRTKGDADGDGIINSIDYIYYVRAVNGGSVPSNINTDFNGDGLISVSDRAIVIQSIPK